MSSGSLKRLGRDRDRCQAAGIPDDVEFATKQRQAQKMIAQTMGGVPFAWFTADETYGQAKWLQGLKTRISQVRIATMATR